MEQAKRTTVLNKRFQKKYAMMIGCVMLLLLALSLGTTYLIVNPLLADVSSQLLPDIAARYAQDLKSVQVKLLGSCILFVIVIIGLSFYASNRIAGPIFRIEEDIKNVIERNDFDFRFHIRKKDDLHDLVDSLNRLMDHLQKQKVIVR